jgi:hypothetical protein
MAGLPIYRRCHAIPISSRMASVVKFNSARALAGPPF